MSNLHFSYIPKKENIQYMHVCRQRDFRRNSIHMHDHHELVLVTSPSVIKIVNNGKAFTLTGPCILINCAGSFHEVVEVSMADYESHVVFFHPRVLDGLPEEMLFREYLFCSNLSALPLSNPQMQELVALTTFLSAKPYTQQKPLLLALFAAVAQLLKENTPIHASSDLGYIFDAIDLLRTDQQITLGQLAAQFHVCQTKLKADFKQLTGLPVMTYRNQIRLESARLLLESADLPQSQIAYQCGFTDESYFIRAFRKKYGITPAVYRRQQRNGTSQNFLSK